MRWIERSAGLLLYAIAALLLGCGDISAEDRVYPNPESVMPLAVGSRVPSARVTPVEGDPIDLADVTRERGALLVFYRGGW